MQLKACLTTSGTKLVVCNLLFGFAHWAVSLGGKFKEDLGGLSGD